MTKKIFRLALADSGLACDTHKWVTDALTIHTREMVIKTRIDKQGRQRRVKEMENKEVHPWSMTTWSDGTPCLATYPGFWAEIRTAAVEQGFYVEMHDMRTKLPPPNIAAALRGMRKPQKAWLVNALAADSSGLLGAPTRFGKSYAILGYCKAYEGLKIVVTAPGKDLCKQLYDFLVAEMPNRRINGVWSGGPHKTQSADITVCSIDSLDKMDTGDTDLLLIDEPHACVADGRIVKVNAFEKARRIGFGATLTGRFDKKDSLIIGVIGPIISSISYKEAVAQGAISPLTVVIKRVRFSKDTVPGRLDRDQVYDRLIRKSKTFSDSLKKICGEMVPEDWQTMIFISNEKQADYLMDKAMPPHATVAMAKKVKDKERAAIVAGIADNSFKRVVASRILAQGVTFPHLKVVANAEGGGANTGSIQKPGRLLQVMPGKNYGVYIDFLFTCIDSDQDPRNHKPYSGLIGECYARIKAYEDIGYDIIYVDTEEEIKEIVKNSYAA